MMDVKEIKTGYRELMIKFTCGRCGKEHIEPMLTYKNVNETYGYLHSYKPPEPWKELLHGPVLCPDCYSAYKKFMQNEEV